MTNPFTEPDLRSSPRTTAVPEGRPGRRRWIVLAAAAMLVIVLAGFGVILTRGGDDGAWQTSDIGEQGDTERSLADHGARLLRRSDGLSIDVTVPTPEPGSYEYPTGDMVPPGAEPHPSISPGASDAPEVFTLWLFAFNEPSLCSEGQCDTDDFAPGAAARGGVYQVDGRVGDGDRLHLEGNVRLGQSPTTGAPLDDPEGAEIHIAIAPHGMRLSGDDGIRQLNSSVGNPTLWWAASFTSPDQSAE